MNKGGEYEIRVNALQGQEMGNFDFFMDGKKIAELDFNAGEKKMTSIIFLTHLDKGMHDFRIVPRRLVSKYNYFMIDSIDFVPKKLN